MLSITAQSSTTVATTVDVAQTTVGISIGRMSGAPLWSVDRQPLLSSFDAPTYVTVSRGINTTITFDLNLLRYLNRHFAVGATFAYIGLTVNDNCRVTQDGGDALLAAFCSQINQAKSGTAASLFGAQARYRMSTSSALQPMVTLTLGLAATPTNPVALSSDAGDQSIMVYRASPWSTVHAAEELSVGVQTPPTRRLQFRAEVRDLHIAQVEVTGPSAGQESLPLTRSVGKQFFSVVMGADLVLRAIHGRRY